MFASILSTLADCQKIVVSTHTRPDGDAIGSQLALGLFLVSEGKDVLLINQDPAPYTLDWLPGIDRIQLFNGSLEQRQRIEKADALIVLDTNNEDRLGDVGPSLRAAPGKKILIDHHTAAEDWFDIAVSDEWVSSTGELIYDLIVAWNVDGITPDVASALYVAVMTDTGSFRFSNVTGHVHHLIGDLVERGGLDTSEIHARIFDRRSPEGLDLLSRVLSTLELYFNGQVGSMVISRRFLNETGANIEEAEGFVNHILSVEGVRVAILYTQTERGTKVSFRSKGDAHVHLWAQAFGGGGHRNAAGAFVRQPLEETMKLVIDKGPKYVDLKESGATQRTEMADEDLEYLASLINDKEKNR